VASRQRGATDPAGDREILSAGDVARTVARMAHQIIEKTSLGGEAARPVVLLGIPSRGAPLARRLAELIAEFSDVTVPVGALDVTLYRDDLRRRPNRPLESTTLPEGGIDDCLVVLVDDVLFSGRTVKAALDELFDHGRPAKVELAILIDRAGRKLPVAADYTGLTLDVTARCKVVVKLDPTKPARDSVTIIPSKPTT